VRLAHLSQELDELDPTVRVLEALESVRTRIAIADGRELTAGQLCERFGFVGNSQWTAVGELSGGERRRLQLMRLMMGEPNVLLLDEPTNDLDIDTLTALEDLLDGWPGTLVVVSHDRYFVERVCDDVYALTDNGGIRHLPGGIEQYVELRHEATAAAAPPPARAGAAPVAKGTAIRQARKDLARLERDIERLTAREAELHVQMAEHATDYDRIATLDAELRDVVARRTAAEEEWLVLAEAAG
jgi:ATP-binding cassette subfamily F protein uup